MAQPGDSAKVIHSCKCIWKWTTVAAQLSDGGRPEVREAFYGARTMQLEPLKVLDQEECHYRTGTQPCASIQSNLSFFFCEMQSRSLLACTDSLFVSITLFLAAFLASVPCLNQILKLKCGSASPVALSALK